MQAEAAELAASPPRDPDAERRQDLTHMTVWAVDSAETTEVDDAISMEPGPDGRHRLWVHIADPTRWLQPGTALDREAARRTTSLYLPTGNSLPSRLCVQALYMSWMYHLTRLTAH